MLIVIYKRISCLSPAAIDVVSARNFMPHASKSPPASSQRSVASFRALVAESVTDDSPSPRQLLQVTVAPGAFPLTDLLAGPPFEARFFRACDGSLARGRHGGLGEMGGVEEQVQHAVMLQRRGEQLVEERLGREDGEILRDRRKLEHVDDSAVESDGEIRVDTCRSCSPLRRSCSRL